MTALHRLIEHGWIDKTPSGKELEQAEAELKAMRQLISEQMTRIEQQQAVVNAARMIEGILPDLLDAIKITHQELVAFEALYIALAALPQLVTKDKHE